MLENKLRHLVHNNSIHSDRHENHKRNKILQNVRIKIGHVYPVEM